MILLICLILSCIAEIACTQICHNDQGNLTLPEEKSFLTKLAENDHITLFVDKQEQLTFMCQNNQEVNEIKLFESAENVIHHEDEDIEIATKQENTVTCDTVCNVTVIRPKIDVTSHCNINETLGTLTCGVNTSQQYKGYSASITYWILDYGDPPDHAGKFKKCTEFDKDFNAITSGEHNTHSFNCKVNITDGPKTVIMKVKKELKTRCHIATPIFCPKPEVEENYLIYKFTPAEDHDLIPTKFLPGSANCIGTQFTIFWAIFLVSFNIIIA